MPGGIILNVPQDLADRGIDGVAAMLAATERLLVGCDFDGTLAPIVGQPDAARALPGGLAALQALAALPRTHVAMLSGRARGDLARLVGNLPGIMLIGSHGAEWGTDLGETLTGEQGRLLREVIRSVSRIAAGVPGVLLEKKPGSVAVHVRGASRGDAAAILEAVGAGPAQLPGVAVIHGKEVLELCVVEVNKGAAISRLQDIFGPTATTYLGDDTTDESVFERLGESDVGFKVGPGPSMADFRLDGPADVVAALAVLAQRRRALIGSAQRQLGPHDLGRSV